MELRNTLARCPQHDAAPELLVEQRDIYMNTLLRCPQCEYRCVLLAVQIGGHFISPGPDGERKFIAPPGSTEPWGPPITQEEVRYVRTGGTS